MKPDITEFQFLKYGDVFKHDGELYVKRVVSNCNALESASAVRLKDCVRVAISLYQEVERLYSIKGLMMELF